MVKLGSLVRDKISGFQGTATARTVYLNGCVSICIEGPIREGAADKDGDPKRPQVWCDEQRVVVLDSEFFKPEPSEADTGGEPDRKPPTDGAW